MDAAPTLEAVLHLLAAWIAGALIGWERESHGRAAGLRTHALVALASGVMMAVASDPELLVAALPVDVARVDPARLAQGIMTGIGFLGAGVIFKEGASVHGLTTAASIWLTAALGILFGSGFMTGGVIGTALALVTLGAFRKLERVIARKVHAIGSVRFRAGEAPDESGFLDLIAASNAKAGHLSYAMNRPDGVMEYRFGLMARDEAAMADLIDRLRALPSVEAFEFSRNS
jgi:putative Mg2+ transporter-C (MgtC) family protein